MKTGKDLVDDILFRIGEPTDDSSTKRRAALQFLNRAYQTLATGSSEFLPSYVEDWWWLRETGTLVLEPVIEGSVAVVQDSAVVAFSVAPSRSLVGRRLRLVGRSELYVVSVHAHPGVAATLDTVFTGPTGAYDYRAMRVEYALSTSVAALISPIIGFGTRPIPGTTPERLDEIWPLARLDKGYPQYFSLEDEQTVRFSSGGLVDESIRLEYRYKPLVVALADDAASQPLLPDQYRHLLADMALTLSAMEKNDTRYVAISRLAGQGILAMVRENRHRLVKMDGRYGKIIPRSEPGPHPQSASGFVFP